MGGGFCNQNAVFSTSLVSDLHAKNCTLEIHGYQSMEDVWAAGVSTADSEAG